MSTDVRYPFEIHSTIDHTCFHIIDDDLNEIREIVKILGPDSPVKIVVSFRPVSCISRVNRFETKLILKEKNLGIKVCKARHLPAVMCVFFITSYFFALLPNSIFPLAENSGNNRGNRVSSLRLVTWEYR